MATTWSYFPLMTCHSCVNRIFFEILALYHFRNSAQHVLNKNITISSEMSLITLNLETGEINLPYFWKELVEIFLLEFLTTSSKSQFPHNPLSGNFWFYFRALSKLSKDDFLDDSDRLKFLMAPVLRKFIPFFQNRLNKMQKFLR